MLQFFGVPEFPVEPGERGFVEGDRRRTIHLEIEDRRIEQLSRTAVAGIVDAQFVDAFEDDQQFERLLLRQKHSRHFPCSYTEFR